ncbi:hypothetical protein ElyMa_005456200 [Elysia marginata]|uniref:Uncharacterized protein n=1 Tax=Elysia marginata TaxID=1093978 RepID=A0AAV4ENG0_9GAST|nr:hypothetical protein ElyMa_005456200 [Elysia marginata]
MKTRSNMSSHPSPCSHPPTPQPTPINTYNRKKCKNLGLFLKVATAGGKRTMPVVNVCHQDIIWRPPDSPTSVVKQARVYLRVYGYTQKMATHTATYGRLLTETESALLQSWHTVFFLIQI